MLYLSWDYYCTGSGTSRSADFIKEISVALKSIVRVELIFIETLLTLFTIIWRVDVGDIKINIQVKFTKTLDVSSSQKHCTA